MISKINEIIQLNNSQYPNGGGTPALAHGEPTPSGQPQDRVTLSPQARQASKEVTGGVKSEQDLNDEEKQAVNQLKKRDAEVKAHESAHMAAGAGIVQGGASFEFQKGPDGRMYAVGGEVKIDVSPERTPEATISKMQQVRAAALAPAEPSGTDRAVAAQAGQIEAQARMEQTEETLGNPLNPTDAPQGAPPSENPTEPNPTSEDAYSLAAFSPQNQSSAVGRRVDLSI